MEEYILKLVANEPCETVETDNIEINEENLSDAEKLTKLIKEEEKEVGSEYLSEILNTGKRFGFPYILDVEKYKEFTKTYPIVDWCGTPCESQVLHKTRNKYYVRLSVDIVVGDGWKYEGIEGLIAKPKFVMYTEDTGWDYDNFIIPIADADGRANLVKFLKEATSLLGEPDFNEKKELLEYYNEELEKTQKVLDRLCRV